MSSVITVVDYGVGNLASIANMIKKAGGSAVISSDPEQVSHSPKLVLPGVGSFDECAERLRSTGMLNALRQAVEEREAHLLGICVGFQLLGHGSEEGELPGLGWLDAATVRLRPAESSPLKVPHMGWSEVDATRPSWVIDSAGPELSRFYFLHGFHVVCNDETDIVGQARYGEPIVAAALRGRVAGVQFHPEKSHRHGLGLFTRYLEQL